MRFQGRGHKEFRETIEKSGESQEREGIQSLGEGRARGGVGGRGDWGRVEEGARARERGTGRGSGKLGQDGEGTSRAQFRRERTLACASCGVLEVGVCHRRQERM